MRHQQKLLKAVAFSAMFFLSSSLSNLPLYLTHNDFSTNLVRLSVKLLLEIRYETSPFFSQEILPELMDAELLIMYV